MRAQRQTGWHPGINLIPFKQKNAWPPNPPESSSPRVEEPNVKCPSQAASHSLSRPQSPQDVLPPALCPVELGARGVPLVQALLPIRKASSPPWLPPSFHLAALALTAGHSASACGAGSRSGREDGRSGQRPHRPCSGRGFLQAGRRPLCSLFSVQCGKCSSPAHVVLVSSPGLAWAVKDTASVEPFSLCTLPAPQVSACSAPRSHVRSGVPTHSPAALGSGLTQGDSL